MLLGLGAYVLAIFFFWLASRTVAGDESTRAERAQAAGEAIEAT